ncbi:MAG: helix-turn-helix transcriptional regulator [Actinophytocola sp.]|uniref:helix-turn-helix domain-containing protein n=1 Tax=Actinophytocola sp. TaxID=1872138 RepID=UPI003C70FA3A
MTSQFGALLRQLRMRVGMTQEGLAERSELGVRTIRGLETGERADPRVGTVRRLADALELAEAERVELFAAAGHAVAVPGQGPEPGPPPASLPAPTVRSAGIPFDFTDYGDGSTWAPGCTGKHAQLPCLQADMTDFVSLLMTRLRHP